MKKAFIDVIDPEDADGLLARAYRRVGGKRGSIANIYQSQSLNPKSMMAHLDLYMSLMYADSPLTRVQREIIATVVSVVNDCAYCVLHHHEALVENWEEAPEPEQLTRGDKLDSMDTVMVEFAIKLTENPGEIAEKDYKQLAAQGFTDRAVLDLTMVIGYFNFVNRLVQGTGVKIEPDGDREYDY